VPTPSSVPIVATPDIVLATIPETATTFIGDGATRYAEQILRSGGARHHRIAEVPTTLAAFIAILGQRLAERGEAGPPHALQPLYVRRPDAELERLRKTSS
jgi:hypothetical protein